MTPRSVPTLKTRLRDLDVAELEKLAQRCLGAATASEVEEILGTALQGMMLPAPEAQG